MVPLLREKLRAIRPSPWVQPDVSAPLQTFMGRDSWRVAIASMLLCRTRRIRVEWVMLDLLKRWPGPEYLCRADAEEVERVVRRCGLHRTRARQLIRFSCLYLGDGWEELQELPGVGVYVADAVGLFCLGCTELESKVAVLRAYVQGD